MRGKNIDKERDGEVSVEKGKKTFPVATFFLSSNQCKGHKAAPLPWAESRLPFVAGAMVYNADERSLWPVCPPWGLILWPHAYLWAALLFSHGTAGEGSSEGQEDGGPRAYLKSEPSCQVRALHSSLLSG